MRNISQHTVVMMLCIISPSVDQSSFLFFLLTKINKRWRLLPWITWVVDFFKVPGVNVSLCFLSQTSMSVSRLLVPKVQPAWMKSTASAVFVLRDTLDHAAKSVSATNLSHYGVSQICCHICVTVTLFTTSKSWGRNKNEQLLTWSLWNSSWLTALVSVLKKYIFIVSKVVHAWSEHRRSTTWNKQTTRTLQRPQWPVIYCM